MNPERLGNIISKVYSKYSRQQISPLMVHCLYNDLSAVIRGLHQKEHFLNVSIDIHRKFILCKDEETLNYLGVLPYLDNRLMGDNSVYFVHLLIGDCAYQQCAVQFIDLYDCTDDSKLGFDVEVYPIIPLGVYYSDTNDFIRWRI